MGNRGYRHYRGYRGLAELFHELLEHIFHVGHVGFELCHALVEEFLFLDFRIESVTEIGAGALDFLPCWNGGKSSIGLVGKLVYLTKDGGYVGADAGVAVICCGKRFGDGVGLGVLTYGDCHINDHCWHGGLIVWHGWVRGNDALLIFSCLAIEEVDGVTLLEVFEKCCHIFLNRLDV